MDRKKIILAVLVVIFIVSLVYRVMHPFKQGTVSELTYVGKRVVVKSLKEPSGSADHKASRTEANVLIDLFLNPPQHKAKHIRNLFAAETTQKTAAPTQTTAQKDRQKAALEVPKQKDPLESAKNDLSRFAVFGMFESGDKKVVFLERGKEVLVVRKGDRIDGKYLVENITDKRVTLKSQQVGEPLYIAIGDL